MKKKPFKMKIWSGYRNSPIKHDEGSHKTLSREEHIAAHQFEADKYKEEMDKRTAEVTGKITKVADDAISLTAAAGMGSRLGPAGLAYTLYDMYSRGQKHSGGRIGYEKNPNYDPNKKGPKHGDIGSNAQFIPTRGKKHHEGFMAESKKKTKSIFNKKKKK